MADHSREKVGVSIPELAYDFGTVKESAPQIVHEFEISNNGKTAIAIVWVKPQMRLHRIRLSAQTAPPGRAPKSRLPLTLQDSVARPTKGYPREIPQRRRQVRRRYPSASAE